MNIERFILAERARIHAALGDPARLAIVDTLVSGDAAPGELGTALDLPTNLVAHHLKVLEEAGLIVRTRSESDRRRTYVRLEPAALAAIATPALLAAKRVVFVCTQNSARSQLAAAIWSRRSHVPVVSAGTQPAERVHPRALKVARRHDLDPTDWHTAHLSEVVRRDDLLIAVCDNAHEHLPPEQRARLHWSVPDPAQVDTDAAFEAAYTELADRIDRLAPALSPASLPGAADTTGSTR
ncbi:helix-turn-helix domain-containing protein [Kribbella qitaiheensis]|uniref:Helix-turn-helix domain-containing protein n=1 Tax=Kribbella qitaiheensis TaxID=1544730 RepID=A0A7G6WW50_9ACTN|nr:helix-turn-helix domain-containing protein [Kribbella qitaiheensis]QNE18215.1 helix-turn-helix domain-containing protein [Kribbella qitaiheensis]